MKKLKGQGWEIEEMLKVVLVLMIFAGSLTMIIAVTGGLNNILQAFCVKNPSWCGPTEYPPCVCCEVNTNLNLLLDIPVADDFYEPVWLWTTKDRCRNFVLDKSGRIYSDPSEFDRCGQTNHSVIEEDLIFHDRCTVPDRFVRSGLPPCICCGYNPDPGVLVHQWDATFMCRDRLNWSFANESICGPLYILPTQAEWDTLLRIGEAGGAPYCRIPYPYNQTSPP